MLYVAVDIGCIECEQCSAVLGVFDTLDAAQSVLDDHETRHNQNWSGQHSFEIFEVESINSVVRQEY